MRPHGRCEGPIRLVDKGLLALFGFLSYRRKVTLIGGKMMGARALQ